MAPGFPRDISAAARARAVNRPSLGCTRSWCCSILLSVKRVPSLLPEAKQSIPRREAEVTVQQVTSHFRSRCILLSIGFSSHVGQFMFSMGAWSIILGSFLRPHAKNLRPAKAEKGNGQEIHQIDNDIEGEAKL